MERGNALARIVVLWWSTMNLQDFRRFLNILVDFGNSRTFVEQFWRILLRFQSIFEDCTQVCIRLYRGCLIVRALLSVVPELGRQPINLIC